MGGFKPKPAQNRPKLQLFSLRRLCLKSTSSFNFPNVNKSTHPSPRIPGGRVLIMLISYGGLLFKIIAL